MPQLPTTDLPNNVANRIRTELLLQTTRSWNGELLPEYGPGQPQVTLLRLTIPAGTPLVTHRHPVICAGLLLQGRLRVTTQGGEVMEMAPGDSASETVGTWHHAESLGPEDAVLLVFYAGRQGQPLTIIQTGD